MQKIALKRFIKCVGLEKKYKHVENDASFYTEARGSTLLIFFEWSNGKLDWRHNFNFPAKPYRDMKNLWFCHRGFLKVWKSIEPYIADDINNPAFKRIEIVGYSHGGAIAQLCHEYVKFNRPDVEVVGFGLGAPRVFWGVCRRSVKERFKDFVVIRNGRDIVTHLPPVLFGFHHVCDVKKIGRSIGPVKDHYNFRYVLALHDYERLEEIGDIINEGFRDGLSWGVTTDEAEKILAATREILSDI